ncbi:hypothetical protein [Shewanella sp. 10B]|uniref:hypothetical protein n=1 Tax=Shewanella sp. 10B TaxID=2943322 RepID=UPI00201AF8CA|nr:hypothetical protein [Shewanella sp. 10B]
MTPQDLYKLANINYNALPAGQRSDQYARTVVFEKTTLHAPVNSKYLYSSQPQNNNSTSTLYSY